MTSKETKILSIDGYKKPQFNRLNFQDCREMTFEMQEAEGNLAAKMVNNWAEFDSTRFANITCPHCALNKCPKITSLDYSEKMPPPTATGATLTGEYILIDRKSEDFKYGPILYNPTTNKF